jgi:hypothetical protein
MQPRSFRTLVCLAALTCVAAAACAQPANDNCANAFQFIGGENPFPTNVAWSNVGATNDGAAPCAPSHADVWFRFTPQVYANYYIATSCTGYDTVLSVHDGCGGPVIACNDDGVCGFADGSNVLARMVQGNPYYIRIAGYGSGNAVGSGVLQIYRHSIVGDTCADAIPVFENVPALFTTTGCYSDPLPAEDLCNGHMSNSIFFTYTPTAHGIVTASFCDTSSYTLTDPTITVFRRCDDTFAIACNDDTTGCGLGSSVEFSAVSGYDYIIRVSGYGSSSGSGELRVVLDRTTSLISSCGPSSAPGGSLMWGFLMPDYSPYRYGHSSGPQYQLYPGTPLSLADDGYAVVPIGFTFPFYEQEFTQVCVSSNGYLQFGEASSYSNNTTLGDPAAPNNIIAALWDDFNPALGGSISYTTRGVAPTRQFIVTWDNLRQSDPADTATCSFQAVIKEDGYIELRYGALRVPAAGTYDYTIGKENTDASLSTGFRFDIDLQVPIGILSFLLISPNCPRFDTIDFNNDGVSPDTQDIADFVSVYGGGSCSNDPFCNDIDFNNDEVSPDLADLEALLCVYGGGGGGC